jgi:hypothetical protein
LNFWHLLRNPEILAKGFDSFGDDELAAGRSSLMTSARCSSDLIESGRRKVASARQLVMS